MRSLLRSVILAGLASMAFPAAGCFAAEQALKIVFPFSAGGSADAVSRLVAEHLQNSLGRPVIVENKVGASGRIGALAVKDAPPDGSTLLFAGSSQLTLQPHLYPDLGYDPAADFVPISQVVRFDQALAISSNVPAQSVKELLVWLKANPDKAIYGSPGAGTFPHFAGMEFGRLGGLDFRHVAYRGTPAALPDLLSGRIAVFVSSPAELIELHKSGSIRILATTGSSRSMILPDVPTLRENGIDVEVPGWFAFYAPARTPAELIERLQNEIIAIIRLPDVHTKILAVGFEPTATTSAELKKIQLADFERWGPIVKASGYKSQQ
ncbi:tripartite-type tricarboxylate transporter receptor subunit TctC [Bradyrhizobium algeriense]|uniref:Tripartite-type tricarboxylate transporter receptor subunit TctC n=1 Tax=Bradyrhizobium algeriense TaxID=634784 RepID=A0ABU8B7Y4_9BRAD